MNINEISKYNFQALNGVSKKTPVKAVENKTSEVKDKYQRGLDIQNVTYSANSSGSKKEAVLTQEEKNYFSQLYPSYSNEINTYQVFKSQSNSITGKLIDIKG